MVSIYRKTQTTLNALMELIIRLATDQDKDAVLALLNGAFSRQQRGAHARGEEYWNWKFKGSPFGHSILSVAVADQKIVGVDHLWPWEFVIRGKAIRALQPCDTVVDEEFRGKGIFTKLRLHGLQIAQERGYHLIFNFPNKNSLPGNLQMGWHFQGKITWRVRILKPLQVLRSFIGSGKASSFHLDDQYRIDASRLDKLAQRDSGYDGYIKANRVEGFHVWRYLQHPYRSYGMVIYEQGSRSTAAVFTVNQNGNNREMVVVDLIGATENAVPAIKQAITAAREMGVGFVTVMDNPRFGTRGLWKAGFISRKLKNMVVLPLDLNLEGISRGYANWSLMACMHDSI
jgi:predicted N-acetyltransferase YhbS